MISARRINARATNPQGTDAPGAGGESLLPPTRCPDNPDSERPSPIPFKPQFSQLRPTDCQQPILRIGISTNTR